MRVLVACEWSNTVRDAFLARGHDAYSCDLQRAEHPNPNWRRHIRGDVRPHQFGDPYCKATLLWLYGLPPLIPTNIVEPIANWVDSGHRKKQGKTGVHRDPNIRSKTFEGIARAMAKQWG